jgi:hypothetical protein
VILDKAGQKGTGKWTVGHAVEMGVPLSVIGSAVEARILSSLKSERVAASKDCDIPAPAAFSGSRQQMIEAVRDALYASKIISYAQGFVQLGAAAAQYGWTLNFGDIASIWRGGCIIRAQFLNHITEAYRRDAQLKNLILDPFFRDILMRTQANWRTAVQAAISHGVAVPAFGAALAYFDSYRQERLPANLLQAQRDFDRVARDMGSKPAMPYAISTPLNWNQSAFLLGNGAFGSATRNEETPQSKLEQLKLLREVLKRNAAMGYGDYRAPPLLQDAVADQYSFNNHALRRFNERLKDAADPNGILLPGRGGIWPKALRALRGAIRK